MDFFDYDFNVTEIVLACKVPAGTGDAVHSNRASHGLALNMNGEKIYKFKSGTSLTVKANDIIFLPEHSDYVVVPEAPGDCYAINFKISERQDFKPFVMHMKSGSRISDIFISAEKAFRTKKNGYSIKCKADLYSLIYAMIYEHGLTYSPSAHKKLIAPAIEYIHNFYSEQKIGISFLAELCGIKNAYFERIFLSCYGISAIQYINRLKLERAKELLRQSDCSIKSVSEMSGFNNIYYFCRYFKKSVGLTPSEYKYEKTLDITPR